MAPPPWASRLDLPVGHLCDLSSFRKFQPECDALLRRLSSRLPTDSHDGCLVLNIRLTSCNNCEVFKTEGTHLHLMGMLSHEKLTDGEAHVIFDRTVNAGQYTKGRTGTFLKFQLTATETLQKGLNWVEHIKTKIVLGEVLGAVQGLREEQAATREMAEAALDGAQLAGDNVESLRASVQHDVKELLSKLREYAASQAGSSDSAAEDTSTIDLIQAGTADASTRDICEKISEAFAVAPAEACTMCELAGGEPTIAVFKLPCQCCRFCTPCASNVKAPFAQCLFKHNAPFDFDPDDSIFATLDDAHSNDENFGMTFVLTDAWRERYRKHILAVQEEAGKMKAKEIEQMERTKTKAVTRAATDARPRKVARK